MHDNERALLTRIDRLERKSRRLTLLAGGVMVLALVSGLRSGGPESLGGVTFEDGMVTARGLRIVDAEGVNRVEIGADRDEQRRSKAFGIVIRDVGGAERFGVGVMEDDSVVLGMDAAVGVGSPMRDRLALMVSPDGSAAVMLIDNKTSVPVRMITDGEGGGGLEFIDYNEETKMFSVKRQSFDGETEEQFNNDGGEGGGE